MDLSKQKLKITICPYISIVEGQGRPSKIQNAWEIKYIVKVHAYMYFAAL